MAGVESKRVRFPLMAGAALTAFVMTGPVSAQSKPGADDDSAGAFDEQEIIVTAQKRSELARDVPLSVSAASGAQLERVGVVDTRDLTSLVPGLKMDRIGGFTAPAIRGVSTQLTVPGAEPNVATYLDGVYQSGQLTGAFDLPDVERIEVLKGPQGTLFGRNATGGAIQVFTLSPSYDTSGRLFASYGTFNEAIVKGFVTGALVPDKVAGSFSAYYRRSDGYYHNLLDGGKSGEGDQSWIVRGKLKFDPTDWLSVTTTAYASHRDDDNALRGLPLNRNTVDRFSPDAIIPTKPFDYANNVSDKWGEEHAFSIKADADLGFATLASITGYSKSRSRNHVDSTYAYTPSADGIIYDVREEARNISQEVNLASSGNKWVNYTVGVYYYDGYGAWNPDYVTVDIPAAPPTLNLAQFSLQETLAYAAFGELFVNITDRLSLITGLRYSREKRLFKSIIVPTFVKNPELEFRGSQTFYSLTPRVSLRYEIVDDTNVYFTYSQGYKSGLYNSTDANTGIIPAVNPEKAYAYEVGVKSKAASWLDFNLAGYHYDYENIQVNAYQTVNGIPLAIVQNAASARINGIDFEAVVKPVSGLTFQLGVSVLDAKFEKYDQAAVIVPNTLPDGTPIGGNHGESRNLSGFKLVRAPNWTVNLTILYSTQFAGGKLDLSSQVYHSDEFFFDPNNRISQPSYTTLGARAGWSPDDTGLTFSVFGKNLTDETLIQGAFITEGADGVSFSDPRTYGVSVEYRF